MKMLSLFSGVGGLDLAAYWAGIETVAFCEIDPYCRGVLSRHWPGVPIFDDVCKINKEVLDNEGVGSIDIVAGGYPCQPFSCAGERRGKTDNRHLWPEMYRIVTEIKPLVVVCENVAGHVSMGLDDVLADLAAAGYTTQPFIIPAAGIGALHKRERVFIVAYTDSIRLCR